MKRIFTATLPITFLAFLAPAASLVVPSSVAAQDSGGDKVNMVIIYGDDACPESTEAEITVCARKAESERYRIPENLRQSDSTQNVAWAQRVESFEMVGAFGTHSCTPTGAGADTGCTAQMIKAAYAEKANGSEVRFGQLIEAARAERLSSVDADAAAEQARVEMIEKEYMERIAREGQKETHDDSGIAPNGTPQTGANPNGAPSNGDGAKVE